ncbi:MAG: hypothetical protein QXR45_14825 [Candidatus Bathyarchaeia archaeon]
MNFILNFILKLVGTAPRRIRRHVIEIAFLRFHLIMRLLFKMAPLRIESPQQLLEKLNNVEGYEELAIQTFQNRIGAIIYGETTGRFIVITNPSLVRDYKMYIGDNEGEYREKIKGYLKNIEEFLSAKDATEKGKFLKTVEENKFLKTLFHEYLHWYMLKETSTATLIESMSWMIRILQIILTESLHREVRSLPRVIDLNPMDRDEAKKKIDEILKDIDRVAQNHILLETFRYLLSHLFILYGIISDAVAVIVEPITWVLMKESNSIGMLNSYFSYNVESYNLAKEILEKTIDISKKYSEKQILEMARKSLDIPLNEFNSYFKEKKVDIEGQFYNELAAYYCRRFMRLANNGESTVRTSEDKDKSYSLVLNYVFSFNSKIILDLIRILSEILSEEKEAFNFIAGKVLDAFSKGIYAQPSVFTINPETLEYHRYDPLAGLTERKSGMNVYVRRTRKTFNGLEDLVGDLPLTHRTLLLELSSSRVFYRGTKEILWSGEICGPLTFFLKYYESIAKEIADFDNIYMEIVEIGGWDPIKVINLMRGKVNEEIFRDYLLSWSYMVFRLGKRVKSMCGLHGIWQSPDF